VSNTLRLPKKNVIYRTHCAYINIFRRIFIWRDRNDEAGREPSFIVFCSRLRRRISRILHCLESTPLQCS